MGYNRKDIEFLQLSKLKNTKMAKKKSNKNMKKGKEHHWHVPDDQRKATKSRGTSKSVCSIRQTQGTPVLKEQGIKKYTLDYISFSRKIITRIIHQYLICHIFVFITF